MKKKIKFNNKIYAYIFAITLLGAVLSFCMIFANVSFISDAGDAYDLTGIQATFGYSEESKLLGTLVYTKFSILNFLIYVILIAGIVLSVLRLFNILKAGTIDWIIAGLFIVVGILYFFMPAFVVYGDAWSGLIDMAIKAGESKIPDVGALVGGFSSILAGTGLIVGLLANKKYSKKK